MNYKEEIDRLVLIYLLNKYPESEILGEAQWSLAHKMVRADLTIQTLQWKLDNLSVSR